ncbi:MAG: SDR family NAD(P)-dependent oxidoreductase, partial [Bacteroidia bacterium]
SGIGVEFAKQIAERGLNIVLTARRVERMEALAEEIRNSYQVEVRVVGLDLTKPDMLSDLIPAVADLEIGLLVNNAGMNAVGAFYKTDLGQHLKTHALNTTAPTILAHHYIQPMLERKKGGVIFTASTSSFFPVPYMGNYAATKAYILSLAESMNLELESKGIKVQALCPGYTRSEMSEGVPDNFMMMQPGPVVKKSLDKLMGNYPSVVPGWPNVTMTRILPYFLSRKGFAKLAAKMLK